MSGPLDMVADDRFTPTTVEARFGSGEQEGTEGNELFGYVDELSFCDRALEAAETAAVAEAGSSGKCR